MRFNNRAEICTLRSQTYPFSTTLHFRLHLPNVEMTLDLEVNEVEVKGLTSLASVAWITGTDSDNPRIRKADDIWENQHSHEYI
jgi:hypothetical protein